MKITVRASVIVEAARECIKGIKEDRAADDAKAREHYRFGGCLWWRRRRTDDEAATAARESNPFGYPSRKFDRQYRTAHDALAVGEHFAPSAEIELSGEYLDAIVTYLPEYKAPEATP